MGYSKTYLNKSKIMLFDREQSYVILTSAYRPALNLIDTST